MPEPQARTHARFLTVELRHVDLRLGGRRVLRDVCWRIEPGQRWILMGANGAGKTQLLKLLSGDIWPTPGARTLRRYVLNGESFDDPYGVRDDIAYLGPERQDRYEHYEWNHRVMRIVGTGLHRTDIPLNPLSAAEQRRAGMLLRRLGIGSLASRRFLTLSYGERRLALLARALAWRPRLLLLDEPFSGLDALNRQRLVAALRSLSGSRLPWVISTHRPEDMDVRATHLCFIDRGAIRRRPAGARRGRPMQRRRARSRPPRTQGQGGTNDAPVISLRDASVWREGARVLRGLSFDIGRGERWVIHGPNGGGKSSLIKLLYGELGAARGGSIRREGIVPGVALSVFQRRVGLVAPELQALYPRGERVADVVASGLAASIGLDMPTGSAALRKVAVGLRRVRATALSQRTLRTLSYGQMRRVLFARALVNDPDILLLDEPYAGLDAHTRAAMQSIVDQATRDGVTIVITTHHEDEWPAGVTHELELSDGGMLYCGPVRRR